AGVGGGRVGDEVAGGVSADITSGNIAPGARLPTEQELIAATGVSRTVVREAVAALRAEGLVVTRQGVGAFVPENARRPFRVDFNLSSSMREVLEVMELRSAIEIEAAGLAAERASPAQVRTIVDCLNSIERAIKRGEDAIDQDFALHCSIADAGGNPQFRRLLEHLGRCLIPRQTISGGRGQMHRNGRGYSRTFQSEHREIVRAIRAGAVA